MSLSRQHILSIASGLLLGASYAFSAWIGVCMLVAYVPLLVLFTEESPEVGWRRRSAYAYLSCFLYHGTTNWWIASWQEQTDPYLFATGIGLLVVHPLFLMLPFVALAYIRRQASTKLMLLSFPFCLTALEWIHGQTDFSYPWLTSGYALVNSPLAQVADTIGVYGLTFLVATANASVAWVLLYRSENKIQLIKSASVVLAFIVAWMFVGMVRYQNSKEQSLEEGAAQTVSVMLVQPNENPWDKWSDARVQLAVHMALTDSAIGAHSKPDLVVWSETALPYVIRDDEQQLEWKALTTWVNRSEIALLTGVADRVVYDLGTAPPSARSSKLDPSLKYDVFNAAYMVNTDTGSVQVHRKSMLTPFAERLPFADQLTFAMSWIEWGVGISSWGKGLTRNPLQVNGRGRTLMKLAPIICIESIYPEVARDFVLNGADALCVITNDAWYNGTAGPRQHYDIARMRAIETRRPLLRCANSGITGLISPTGASLSEIPPMTSGVSAVTIVPQNVQTVYVQSGDVLPAVSIAVVVFLLILARIPSLQRILPFRFISQ